MTTTDIIRELCKQNGVSVTNLEKELGFGNGSLTKSDTNSIKADRLLAIAKRFNVTMEYLMGEPEPGLDADMTILQRERNKMSDKDKAKLMKVLAANFDDYNWEEDDTTGNL